MKEKKDNKKKIIILAVITFIIILLSTSFAFFVWNSNKENNINVSLSLSGLDAYIHYNKGTDVLTGTLLPSTDYSGGISTEIELWKDPSAASRNIYGHIYLDITTIGTNLANEPALKWAITSNGEVLNTGDFVGKAQGNSIRLKINIPLSTTKQLFKIYIWLDESMEINDAIEGETISTIVRAEATEIIYSQNAVEYVSSLVKYDYDEVNNDDPDGNVRYMGADPDNYVLFNNELWRIIGVFDVASIEGGELEKRLKIIRKENLGTYSWDNKPTGSGSSNSLYGSNNWADSTLMEVLNNGAYWNRTTGICPYGQNGATTSCDFSTNGLTEESKKLIEDAVWNLGGSSSYDGVTSSMFYEKERGNAVYSGRPTIWIGKIGLMYLSDYGYATSGGIITSRNECLEHGLYNWTDSNYSDCYNNNYLNRRSYQWTLTPYSSNNYMVFRVSSDHDIIPTGVHYLRKIYPTLYLKSSVILTGGNGSKTNPYQLDITNSGKHYIS